MSLTPVVNAMSILLAKNSSKEAGLKKFSLRKTFPFSTISNEAALNAASWCRVPETEKRAAPKTLLALSSAQ
jgi:hypothetical protein